MFLLTFSPWVASVEPVHAQTQKRVPTSPVRCSLRSGGTISIRIANRSPPLNAPPCSGSVCRMANSESSMAEHNSAKTFTLLGLTHRSVRSRRPLLVRPRTCCRSFSKSIHRCAVRCSRQCRIPLRLPCPKLSGRTGCRFVSSHRTCHLMYRCSRAGFQPRHQVDKILHRSLQHKFQTEISSSGCPSQYAGRVSSRLRLPLGTTAGPHF